MANSWHRETRHTQPHDGLFVQEPIGVTLQDLPTTSGAPPLSLNYALPPPTARNIVNKRYPATLALQQNKQ